MKGGSGISGAIGYILGTVIIVPLLLYLISIIFLRPRKISENQISNYIDNSEELVDNTRDPSVSYDEFRNELMNPNRKIGPHVKDITIYLSTRQGGGGGRRQYYEYVYYSKKYRKYFNLLVIVEGRGIVTDADSIIMTVNRDDYNNPAYGTIDNPVPALKFVGADQSIRQDSLDYNKAYMDKIFHDNVKIYLEYIMPKKEFKARYGEK